MKRKENSILESSQFSFLGSNAIKLDNVDEILGKNISANIQAVSKSKSIPIEQQEKEQKIQKQFMHFSILSITLYTLCLLFAMIYNLPLSPQTMDEGIQNIFLILAQQSWNMAQIFCYLIFTLKLKYCFKNTKYEINQKYFRYFYISIASFGACNFLLSLTIILQSVDVISLYQFVIITMIESIIKLIISVFLSISMIYLFIHALFQISVDSDYGHSSFDESTSSSVDKFEQAMAEISIKLSVLSFWSLVSTQIFVVIPVFIYIIWLAIGVDDGLSKIIAILWFYNFIWVICNSINVTCLFLNLPISIQRYNRICHQCHEKAQNMGKQKIDDLNSAIEAKYHQMEESGMSNYH